VFQESQTDDLELENAITALWSQKITLPVSQIENPDGTYRLIQPIGHLSRHATLVTSKFEIDAQQTSTMAQTWNCVLRREVCYKAKLIAHNLSHVFIKMPQLETYSLDSIMLRNASDGSNVEYDLVEAQSAKQNKKADCRRGRNGRAGLWHDCIALGRRSYHRLDTARQQFGILL
jgi:hypothetical protein